MRSGVQELTAPTGSHGPDWLGEILGRLARSRPAFPHVAAAVAMVVALSACTSKPEIATDSYCSIKPTELIDMRDPNLQRLIPVNQGAVLTGDDNYQRFCKGAINKGR